MRSLASSLLAVAAAAIATISAARGAAVNWPASGSYDIRMRTLVICDDGTPSDSSLFNARQILVCYRL